MDNETIERARDGGEPLERLIAEYWPEAYRLAFSILRDRGLAEDAAQEACATIARSLATLKDSGRFRAWGAKIVANRALDAARRRARTQTAELIAEPAVAFDRAESLDLYRALGTLPAVQRAAVLLHYYAGLDSREIAEATGWARSTVRFHLMLARRALREALSTHAATETNEVITHAL